MMALAGSPPPGYPRTCSTCKFSLLTEESWRQHLLSTRHRGNDRRHVEATCDACGQTFTRAGGLTKHRRENRCDPGRRRDGSGPPPSKRHRRGWVDPAIGTYKPARTRNSFEPSATTLAYLIPNTTATPPTTTSSAAPDRTSTSFATTINMDQSAVNLVDDVMTDVRQSNDSDHASAGGAMPRRSAVLFDLPEVPGYHTGGQFEWPDETSCEIPEDSLWGAGPLSPFPATEHPWMPATASNPPRETDERKPTKHDLLQARTVQAIGASRKDRGANVPCPLCKRKLPGDRLRCVEHFLGHLDKTEYYPCHECDIVFTTARDLRWHQVSVRENQTCGYAFAHATACGGHHPPREDFVRSGGGGGDGDHHRLQLWCLVTWQSAIHEFYMDLIPFLCGSTALADERISMAWSDSKADGGRAWSQASGDSLAGSLHNLRISQHSEPALGSAERRQRASTASAVAAQAAVQAPLGPFLHDHAAMHEVMLATRLQQACLCNDAHGARACIRAGVNLDLAAGRDHALIVELLLEAGADVDAPTYDHGTALAAAVLHRRPAVAALLLRHGARQEAVVRALSAMQLAVQLLYFDVAAVLLRGGAAADEEDPAPPPRRTVAATAQLLLDRLAGMPVAEAALLFRYDAHLPPLWGALASRLSAGRGGALDPTARRMEAFGRRVPGVEATLPRRFSRSHGYIHNRVSFKPEF